MERIEIDGAALEIDGDARLVRLVFTRPEILATEHAAKRFTAMLEEWLARSPGAFRVLVDCANVANSTAGWRAEFGRFFKRHAAETRMAWYNASPLIRITIRMFILATRIDGAAFATEREARRWLGLEEAGGP